MSDTGRARVASIGRAVLYGFLGAVAMAMAMVVTESHPYPSNAGFVRDLDDRGVQSPESLVQVGYVACVELERGGTRRGVVLVVRESVASDVDAGAVVDAAGRYLCPWVTR